MWADSGIFRLYLFLGVGIVLISLAVVWSGVQSVRKSRALKTQACPQCGATGSLYTRAQGSLLIEAMLWMSFLFPGILYSVWRNARRVVRCGQCGKTIDFPARSGPV